MDDTRIMQALHIGDKVYEKNHNEPWSITKVIGFGGSSIVYEAKHPQYGTFVLKECFPCDGNGFHFTRREGVACAAEAGPEALEEMKALFAKEWEVSKELGESRSGRILQIYDLMDAEAIETGGKRYQTYGRSCFLRMESLSSQKTDADGYGAFLEEILEDDKDIYLITNIILQTLRALEVVHKKGYIHGDIQHRNIYFRDYHQEKKEVEFALLIDFGTARKLVDGRVVDATSFFSTNGYTAPEMRRGKNVDTRTDIYSVGCLLYFLLTGEYWINSYGGDAGVGNRILDAVDCPEIAKRMVNDIVRKALKEEQKDRYLDATEMLGVVEELQELLQSVNVSEKKLLIQERAKRQVRPCSECYIRRDDLMELLNKKMSEENQGKNYCFLYGVGGEGKSELARAYAEEQKRVGCYQQVFWLTYKPEYGSVGELFRENGYTMVVQETIDCLEKDTLIVVDDYVVVDNYAAMEDGTGSIIEMVKSETGKAHVIFTTRRTPVKEEEHRLLVESENRKEFALQVFQRNFINARKGRGTILEESMPDVERIVELIGYNPMMACLLAREIGMYGEPRMVMGASWYDAIYRFRKSLETSILKSYKRGAKVPYTKDDGNEISKELEVSELMQLLFRDILSLQDISGFESQVLTILCEFPAQYVDRSYLETILGDNEEQCEIYAAINKLEERGFVRVDDSDGWKISMHPLLCEVFKKLDKAILLREEKEAFLKHVLENWLVLEEEERNQQYYLIHEVWKKIKKDVEPEFSLLTSSLLHIKQSECFYKECYSSSEAGVIASVWYQDGIKFFIYDFSKQREILIADLQTRKVHGRYYGDSDVVETRIYTGKEVKLEVVITTGSNVVLKFPDALDGKLIESIPSDFLRNNHKVEGISLPKELKKIGKRAFDECSGLIGDLSIPEGVTEIGDYAFYGCSGLTGNLLISNSVKEIGKGTFGECSGLTGELRIPEGVTKIGKAAFYNCRGLTGELVIPEGVIEIGDYAFCNCSGLVGNLLLPRSITKIGKAAFCNCRGLTGELVIPEGVIEIGDYAFCNCSGLISEFSIPDSVRKMGENAFLNLDGMMDKLATEIGDYTFYDCSRLTDVLIIPEGVTKIEDYAFAGRSSLIGKLVIPDGITEIGKAAFYNCRGLTGDLIIPEGIEEIGEDTFWNCSGLTGSLLLPRSITKIGDYAFYGCSGLKGELIIPDGITEIGDNTFKNCSGLTGNLLLPRSITKIGKAAFYNCRGLTGDLIIPEGVTEIGEYAFRGCGGLTGDLIVSEGVTEIGKRAFVACNFGKIVFRNSNLELGDKIVSAPYPEFICKCNSSVERYAKKNRIPYRYLD